MKLGDLIQSGDFKGEKHVPVIESPAKVKAGEAFKVCLSVGKEIPHPNKPEHHIFSEKSGENIETRIMSQIGG